MKDILPTCYDYKKFLNEAVLKFDISINEARKNMVSTLMVNGKNY